MLSDERIRQIAEDIYCSEGTRAEIEHSIRAALAEAAQSEPEEKPDFEKLESLGWQIAICAMCGTHASAIKPVQSVPVVGEPVALREFADEVKQLCKDFSDRHNRPYMGDVTAAIDGLLAQFVASQTSHVTQTELSETHAIEMRAYEATVANLEQRILELEAERVPDGWIQVSDRLPDSDVSFLAVTDCAGDIHISTMRLPVLIAKNEKQSGEFIRERVTHWMPLPAAPQPKKEGE